MGQKPGDRLGALEPVGGQEVEVTGTGRWLWECREGRVYRGSRGTAVWKRNRKLDGMIHFFSP